MSTEMQPISSTLVQRPMVITATSEGRHQSLPGNSKQETTKLEPMGTIKRKRHFADAGTARIILVDDEPINCKLLKRTLLDVHAPAHTYTHAHAPVDASLLPGGTKAAHS